MRRSFCNPLASSTILFLLASGCGRDPFAPPSRAKSSSTIAATSGPKPTFIAMIVPTPPEIDVEIWSVRALHEANDKRAIFRIMGPARGESAELQPSIVKRAIQEGATALIVYPGDSVELPRVLAEAESKGIPVVLIEKDLAAPEGSKPFPLVEVAPAEDFAKRIVDATIEDLKKASRPIDSTALVLVDRVTDAHSANRVAALKSAAEAAKFPKVVLVPFDSSSEDAAKLAVVDAVKAHPDVAIVLADDSEGMKGASIARAEFAGKPVFFVGGFMDYRSAKFVAAPVRESSYVEGRSSELGGLAVVTALKRLRGEPVDRRSFVKPKFNRGSGAIGAGEDQFTLAPSPRGTAATDEAVKPPQSPAEGRRP